MTDMEYNALYYHYYFPEFNLHEHMYVLLNIRPNIFKSNHKFHLPYVFLFGIIRFTLIVIIDCMSFLPYDLHGPLIHLTTTNFQIHQSQENCRGLYQIT